MVLVTNGGQKTLKNKQTNKQAASICLTNREELSFLTVLAFPKASRMGLAWSSCFSSSPWWTQREKTTPNIKITCNESKPPLPRDSGEPWILIEHNSIYALINDVNNRTWQCQQALIAQNEFPFSIRYPKKIRRIISPRKPAYLH